jgi:membrane-associated phospholipid phosphatase
MKATITNRFTKWVLALSLNSLFYFSSGAFSGAAYLVPPTFVDDAIAFQPCAIWPYLSFFGLILLAFLKVPAQKLNVLTFAIVDSTIIGAIIFFFYPTTIAYPATAEHGLLGALRLLDTPKNCLPSLHGAITLICVISLFSKNVIWNIGLLLWGLLICWSAIAVRQHAFMDIASGLILGALMMRLLNGFLQQSNENH